jgi:uracil-DNA glycosylase
MSGVKIEKSWLELLKDEFDSPYFVEIKSGLQKMKESNEVIYPSGSQIFNAFNLTPVDQVKVVIIGQDPYHNPGEAMGLSFSVPKGKKIPPSLRNIYKEIASDCNLPIPNHGDLTEWAQSGVLLLNTFLTVTENKPASHRNLGWHFFTDAVISRLSGSLDGIVFLLWGNFAKEKAKLLDHSKHLVLNSVHPSPLAGNGFFGNHHFTIANDYLNSKGKKPVDWKITNI